MSADPLRGIDFSERIKPLMQQVLLHDEKRMKAIADLKHRCAGTEEALAETLAVLTDPEQTDRAARNRAVAILEALDASAP